MITRLGLAPSFGFGDRTGLATPGHVAAMREAGGAIQPIFPQQSIREMTRTRRTPEQVMSDALNGMREAGWTGRSGADADHLKTPQDVDETAAVGFVFFTIDPSEHVDQRADDYDDATLRGKTRELGDATPWIEKYRGRSVLLSTGTTIEFSEQSVQRAAVKYGRAIQAAIGLAKHIEQVQSRQGREFEIELSVDETAQPTTMVEHFIIAEQLQQNANGLVSLAPRFIGDFAKGVDFVGDVPALERSLRDHAAIAKLLGPYKLSLHSGSDKLSMYPALARTTQGLFHVKTAGTSYLEALRVVCRHDAALFRRLISFARERYNTDRATYHVSADVAQVPAPETVSDIVKLEQLYLERWCDVPEGRGFTASGRQILHCTFGSTLTHPEWGPLILDLLRQHPETYREVLREHFVRHLKALAF
jgi:hypothetical protein